MKSRKWQVALASITTVVALSGLLGGGASADDSLSPFRRVWERTDKPVVDHVVNRTWMWGPESFTPVIREEYAESPDGLRTVVYFDKSRMEVTMPDGDSDSSWYVTNGLLVSELVTGRMQIGDDSFEEYFPSNANVAGDADDPYGPTYATFSDLLDLTAGHAEDVFTRVVARDGSISLNEDLAHYAVGTSQYAAETNHWIADPFWEFMNSEGTVYEDGSLTNGALFDNPYYATGYPIIDPYWARVQLAGERHFVLIQCFERRCLTYTPSNSAGWEVEAGNVGQHYYNWRYEEVEAAVLKVE